MLSAWFAFVVVVEEVMGLVEVALWEGWIKDKKKR